MKFVIAPDSFKGSLTAKQAALAMATGIRRVFPRAEYTLVPMADGGEGTVAALVDATGGQLVQVPVHDPLDRVVTASYGLLGTSNTAVIEMAAASGLQFVDAQTSNPLLASTYGTGELIKDAVARGVDRIIIGLGGSATVDGGAGMAQALGVHLLNEAGQELPHGGGALTHLTRVEMSELDPRLHQVEILLAADVNNPLTGSEGAARVFGPQKGATPAMVTILERGLAHFATVVKHDCCRDPSRKPGAGAAGGLGFGLLAFTHAEVKRGIDLVLQYTDFARQVVGADYVFTGEGQVDFQTEFGKTPLGVSRAARQVVPGVPVIALAGSLGSGIDALDDDFTAVFAAPSGAKDLHQAITDAPADVALTAENVARLIKRLK
ncbi:glycerate kinase [Limosilactobacillus pontis]|uniref:glycerate kinase family protein n=1 Tax=Limosilactobacillus pontis TaxID=35787 RepID=UPI002F2643DF